MSVTSDIDMVCRLYRHAVAAGEDPSAVVGMLAEMRGVQRPAIWRNLRAGGVLPPYGVGRARGTKPRTRTTPNYEDAPRVHRDPCSRCGVRGDIGCSCPKARVGTVFGVAA